MSNSGSTVNQVPTREIHPNEWNTFLNEFTRDNRGAHARLEIVGADTDVGYQVETENRPFEGVSADLKDRERTVWIIFGSDPQEHITHGIQHAQVIRMLRPESGRGAVLEIEASDGTKSLLELTPRNKYALPPAGERKSRG